MLTTTTKSWVFTVAAASLAVALALTGLGLAILAPAAAPALGTALLAGSFAGTGGAFALLAARVRRLEMENMGLVEELSQEFDRVKDKLAIFEDALAEPRSIEPTVEAENTPLRRVVIK